MAFDSSRSCARLLLAATLAASNLLSVVGDSEQGHVWVEDSKGNVLQELTVDDLVSIRWNHFLSDKEGYAWGYIRVDGSVKETVTGNTKPTGRFEFRVTEKLCGAIVEVEMCCGNPPRKTKFACHKSVQLPVRGDCAHVEAPPPTTTTTTAAPELRELGPLPLASRSRRWASGQVEKAEGGEAEAKASQEDFSVAFVTVWLGPLPEYVEAFAASAEASGATFFVFHTQHEATPKAKNVNFIHMTLAQLASRLWAVEGIREHFSYLSFDRFQARVHECYAEDNPAKGNDLKALYGALFELELQSFTHWGWTDLDTIWGDLRGFLTPSLLSSYDVISAPDGGRPALYLSGQLTVFRNTPHWRRFFIGCIAGSGHVNYGGCYVEGFLSEANLFHDEKVAIWYAALSGARIWVDFSMILITKRWFNLGSGPLLRRDGQIFVVTDGNTRGLPSADIEKANVAVHSLQNRSDCFSEFGEGWSYACVPLDDFNDDAWGVAYEIDPATGLNLWPSPLRLSSNGLVEFAMIHLHRQKKGFTFDDASLVAGSSWKCTLGRGDQKVHCAGHPSADDLKVAAASSSAAMQYPIPNIVHFVLTDRDTRFFDWPCYVAIRSAWEHLRPSELLVHVLDGIEPSTADGWWKAARKYVTSVVPYPRSAVPRVLNGIKVSHPAFIGDFRRMQVLYEWGGIYMDTDALSLRSFDDLRRWRAVFGRQGGKEMRVTVGLMMFERNSNLAAELLERMKKAYSGAWGVHAGHVLDEVLGQSKRLPPGVAVLGHSRGFFASSWLREDFFELMEEAGWIDWSRCWSLHLYNSQTKHFTKDPNQLCRDPKSSYHQGDLCRGLNISVDMNDIFEMVDNGLPLMTSELEKRFEQRALEQAKEYDDPVSHSLTIEHEVSDSWKKSEL